MTPTIGRIVHYYPSESELRSITLTTPVAAVVVAVWGDECVNLKLLPDGDSILWKTSVLKSTSDDHKSLGNCWDWPPMPPARVDPAGELFREIADMVESGLNDNLHVDDQKDEVVRLQAFIARIREAYPAPKTAPGDLSAQGA